MTTLSCRPITYAPPLCRQNALLHAYPDVLVKYRFTNRGGTRFTREMFDACQVAINRQFSLSFPLRLVATAHEGPSATT